MMANQHQKPTNIKNGGVLGLGNLATTFGLLTPTSKNAENVTSGYSLTSRSNQVLRQREAMNQKTSPGGRVFLALKDPIRLKKTRLPYHPLKFHILLMVQKSGDHQLIWLISHYL